MKRIMTYAVPLVALLLAGLFGWYAWNTWLYPKQADFDTTPVWKPGQVEVTPSVAPSASVGPLPGGCAAKHEPIVPVKFVIERMGVESHVLSLGFDPTTGAAEAPPDSDSRGVAWLNEGPKPGSDKGNVVLSAHTYHRGVALGNELYDQSKGLQPGDIIKISDASGKTMCYRYREALKVFVDEYNASPSNVLYDDNGRPQVALVICWNYDWTAKMSKSRIIFYADPITDPKG